MRYMHALPAAVAAALAIAAPASAAEVIQPGVYTQTSVGGCTLNFIYDGGGNTYGGTAAHCVSQVGEGVQLDTGEVFGDVAIIGNADVTETDWAFIKIRPAFLSRVSAQVKGNAGYPKNGYTTPSQTSAGDVTIFSGYGLGFDATSLTREQRRGVLMYDDAGLYTVLGTLIFGDSGGPIVHQKTGRALGIVSRLCIGLCEEEGPTVQGILAQASARGFFVTLRTV